MGTKSDFLPESFIKALQRDVQGFRNWPPKHQYLMAKLIWEAGLKRREHRRMEHHISIGYRELQRWFGRGGFDAMNTATACFEVSTNWFWREGRSSKQNSTKGYKLTQHLENLKEKYLKPKKEAVTRLIYLDAKDDFRPLRSVPNPIAAKQDDDDLGVTATAWRQAKPFNRVPVDLDLLRELYEYLTRMLKPDELAQDDLFIRSNAEDIARRIEWVGQLIRLANTDIAGRGFIIHRYAECKTGRLYASGVSLQTAPRLIRKAALHGLYDYDIENCHYAIFEQLAAKYGYQANAVRQYRANKDEVRNGIANRVGIHKDQAKMALLALMFGAKTTERAENAIPREIGVSKARLLYQDTEFSAINKDVQTGRDLILKGWPKRRSTLLNDLGKPIKLKTKPEVRMAHIIQGIEAMAIRSAITLYPDEIVLLMHDGFVTTRQIDARAVERRIFDDTGYRVELAGGVIELPANLEFAKL